MDDNTKEVLMGIIKQMENGPSTEVSTELWYNGLIVLADKILGNEYDLAKRRIELDY